MSRHCIRTGIKIHRSRDIAAVIKAETTGIFHIVVSHNLLCRRLKDDKIGDYRYYGISFNSRMISNFKQQVRDLLYKVLNRRSEMKSYTRQGFVEMMKYYKLPNPKICFILFS